MASSKIIFISCFFTLITLLPLSLKAKDGGKKEFGVERGLMDGFSLHVTPSYFDFGLSYALLPTITTNRQSFINSTEKKNEWTQLALRLGLYTSGYGIDSWYFNIFAGQINLTQTRTNDSLPNRVGKATGTFVCGGLGYHWFWQHFNLRLGVAAGKVNYQKVDFKDSSGFTVETADPFPDASEDYLKTAGGFDLAIGWAF